MSRTTIQLSEADKKKLEEAQKLAKRKGLDKLDELQLNCPECGSLMDGVKVSAEKWKCPNCQHEEAGLTIGIAGTFALGAIVGLGAAALIHMLSQKEGERH